MTDFNEALRILALDVVGVSDPANVHDDERLRWGDIRAALYTVLPKVRVMSRAAFDNFRLSSRPENFHGTTPEHPILVRVAEEETVYAFFACPGDHPHIPDNLGRMCVHWQIRSFQ